MMYISSTRMMLEHSVPGIQHTMNSLNLFLVVIGAASALAVPQYPAPAPLARFAVPQQVQYSTPLVKTFAPASVYAAPQFVSQQYTPAVRQYAAAPVIKAAVLQYSAPVYSSQYIKPVAILRQSQDDNFDGSFNYGFEAENGISSQANGYVKAISPKEQAQVIQGVYSYTAPDGTPIVTRWYADETGFHAEGAHLPVAPPVPEAIAKSLAYQAANPARAAPVY